MIETVAAPGWGIFEITVDKPSWSEAPDWALWLAQDANGEWWWFDFPPVLECDFWQPPLDHRPFLSAFAGISSPPEDYTKTLQYRFEMEGVELVSPEWENYESKLIRPLWDHAPEWANWLAQDASGYWIWFEEKPVLQKSIWWAAKGNTQICFGKENIISHDWRETLEKRPDADIAWSQDITDSDEEAEMIDDMVNEPPHYTKGEIQCIEVLEQLADDGHDFRVLNAMKYLWRYRHKGGDESIRKAIWYLRRYLD